MQMYHWKIDAAGLPSDIPDDKDDDSADALRYMVMNVFSVKGRVSVAPSMGVNAEAADRPVQYGTHNWMAQIIQENTESGQYSYYKQANEGDTKTEKPTGKKGSLLWDLS
jgi:hypothetical protein